MQSKKDYRADIWRHILLSGITMLLLLLPVGSGNLFGSEGDWYSQHVGIAESIRQAVLNTGSLIPQYILLGAGSSIYDFSYYGLLRPDVLISCLLPEIPMKYIISAYSVLGVIASVNLCYIWLKKQGMRKWFAFGGGILLACAACFYQAHHQIMFVNYMPFLLLALPAVDRLCEKGKGGLLVISLCMIYLHSFYYSIACLVVIGIYTVHKNSLQGGWKRAVFSLGKLIFPVALSVGMAMVLFLPTGLDILSSGKDGGSFSMAPLKMVDLSLGGLLYSPYGCGMTLLTLYCLLLSLQNRRRRFLSAAVLFCLLFPVVSLILNGFLYARSKILIPFAPLLVLETVMTMQELYDKKQNYSLVILLFSLTPLLFMKKEILVFAGAADALLLALWVVFKGFQGRSGRKKPAVFAVIFLVPLCVGMIVNGHETYIALSDERQEHFTGEQLAAYVADADYRFDVLCDGYTSCNVWQGGVAGRTAMYSSITNSAYAGYYYDTLHNPISYNNRVALASGQNCLFRYLMGMKYLMTREEAVPAGYGVIAKNGDYVLARSEDVLPVCYGTTELMGESVYDNLSFPDNLEALCSHAVVKEKAAQAFLEQSAGEKAQSASLKLRDDEKAQRQNKEDGTFSSHIKRENADTFFVEEGGEYLFAPAGKKETRTLHLAKPLSDQILLLSFKVTSNDGKAVVIDINGVRNKLSSAAAPYPNGNHNFIYILEGEETLKELKLEFSGGIYEIHQVRLYTVKKEAMRHSQIIAAASVKEMPEDGKNVYWGRIDMPKSGYFITSYPYRKGYAVFVDGEKIEPEMVNTAFVGFPLSAGKHMVKIRFEAPGYRPGLCVSLVCLAVFGFWQLRQKIRRSKS